MAASHHQMAGRRTWCAAACTSQGAHGIVGHRVLADLQRVVEHATAGSQAASTRGDRGSNAKHLPAFRDGTKLSDHDPYVVDVGPRDTSLGPT